MQEHSKNTPTVARARVYNTHAPSPLGPPRVLSGATQHDSHHQLTAIHATHAGIQHRDIGSGPWPPMTHTWSAHSAPTRFYPNNGHWLKTRHYGRASNPAAPRHTYCHPHGQHAKPLPSAGMPSPGTPPPVPTHPSRLTLGRAVENSTRLPCQQLRGYHRRPPSPSGPNR